MKALFAMARATSRERGLVSPFLASPLGALVRSRELGHVTALTADRAAQALRPPHSQGVHPRARYSLAGAEREIKASTAGAQTTAHVTSAACAALSPQQRPSQEDGGFSLGLVPQAVSLHVATVPAPAPNLLPGMGPQGLLLLPLQTQVLGTGHGGGFFSAGDQTTPQPPRSGLSRGMDVSCAAGAQCSQLTALLQPRTIGTWHLSISL